MTLVVKPQELFPDELDYPVTVDDQGRLVARASGLGRCTKIVADAVDGIVRPQSLSTHARVAALRGRLYEPWVIDQVTRLGFEPEQLQPAALAEGTLADFGVSPDPLGKSVKLTGHADAIGTWQGSPAILEVKCTDESVTDRRQYLIQLWVYSRLFERPVVVAQLRSDGTLVVEEPEMSDLERAWTEFWDAVAVQVTLPQEDRACDSEWDCACEGRPKSGPSELDPTELPSEFWFALDEWVESKRVIDEATERQKRARAVILQHLPPKSRVRTSTVSVTHVVSSRTTCDTKLLKLLAPEVYEQVTRVADTHSLRVAETQDDTK